MKQIILEKVDQIIFAEHKIQSLQSFLHEYRQIAKEYGFDVGKLKSSYVKELLIKEYGDGIGFHERPEKNKKVNLCTIQKLEATTSKQHSIPLA